MAKKKIENEGQSIAKARDKFFEDNEDIIETPTGGRFLKNRLEEAFIAGWKAARQKRK